MRIRLPPLFILIFCFLALVSFALTRLQEASLHPFRKVELQGKWITASEDHNVGYFRKRIEINGPVKHAWLMVAAKDGFEISINRNPVGKQYLWRPTRPFQTGTSQKGQRIVNDRPAMALNFPREYQWSDHKNWIVPNYLDVSKDFKRGTNIVCVEVESRNLASSLNLFGEITLWNGEKIVVRSDETWKSANVPNGPQYLDWTEPGYNDTNWLGATVTADTDRVAWRNVPAGIFEKPLEGQWIQANSQEHSGNATFVTRMFVESEIDEAYLRIATNRRFDLLINRERVTFDDGYSPNLDSGDWVIGRSSALDPISRPELLDPDEIGAFFGGSKFEQPRDAQPNLEEFIDIKPKTHLPFRNYKTTNRAEDGGEFDPTRTLAESRRTPAKPDLPAEPPQSNALKRDRSVGGLLAYSIGNRLKVGWNEIEVRCLAEQDFNWPARIAVDGMVNLKNGDRQGLDSKWHSVSKSGDAVEVMKFGPVNSAATSLPRMQYRGIANDPISFGYRYMRNIARTSLAILSLVAILAMAIFVLARSKAIEVEQCFGEITAIGWPMMLVTSIAILNGILLETAMYERHESIWFQTGHAWYMCLGIALFMGIGSASADLAGRLQMNNIREFGRGCFSSLRELPHTRIWPHLLFWILLLATLLRGYQLDLQPLDDDEYASTQAILSIIETGTPKFEADNVYYTRSPLYHYLTAAIAFPFGGNLWSLRLQSVAWGVATVFLSYLFCSRLLNSRWIGLFSMLLLTIHPFEVFTGHVIRFYQMQQFFALLTVYLFCNGFVGQQQQHYRVATLFAFLCAVLSQEISAVMGVPLLISYILFAKDLGWRNNIQLIIITVGIMLIIAADLIAFKTLCLTRTEGVSPTAEASIKPHFWYPLNLFSIFVGYSRLHVVPSFFFFVGLPLVWRERNRNALATITFLVSGILMTNLLVTHVSLRYQYWLFPLWVIACLVSVRLIFKTLIEYVYTSDQQTSRFVLALAGAFAITLLTIVMSFSPWRIVDSYSAKLLGDSTGCVRWVRNQMRPGDKIAITEPHTHAAFIESGKCDYDISVPLLYDFTVMQDGKLVDRNGGGEVISCLDDLISAFETNDRVWILLNREKFRTRGKNLRWEYPGARFETFVRQNCELKHRTYLWHAYLWDASKGHFIGFSKQQ